MKRTPIYWRMKWRRRAARFVARGLTTRGTVRQYRQHPELKALPRSQRKRARDRQMYWLRLSPPSAMELAYREFRETIKPPDLREEMYS